MARPTWTPDTASDDQRRQWHTVLRAAADLKTATARLWREFRAARDLGIPILPLAEAAKIPRATVYRHIDQEEPTSPKEGGS